MEPIASAYARMRASWDAGNAIASDVRDAAAWASREPLELGAVVKDGSGARWVRSCDGDWSGAPWHRATPGDAAPWASWEDLDNPAPE